MPARIVLSPLAWIGRQGTKALAASIVLGLALPQLASLARPLIGPCVFVFLALAFLRVDLSATRAVLARPGRLALASLWILAALPLAISLVVAAIGRQDLDPGLTLGLALMAAAPPILSAPAVAALLGFEATFLVAVVVVAMVATPLTAPIVASLVAGGTVPLEPVALALRLGALLAGSSLIAFAIRRVVGYAAVLRGRTVIDGLNVVFFFVFAVGAMDGVAAKALGAPAELLRDLAIVFTVSAAGILVTLPTLRGFGADQAFVLGFASGHRNMGLLVAALGGALPEGAWIFFAVAQFPIYLMPLFLGPLARRLLPPPTLDEALPPAR
ncbi:hypothetical protein QNA08_09265 [Chelatococcus sp. SYSU_G07232]|uniref:Na+-dependent transporter n=1 Tax=Chelatococcus albus TaxID=3047466 RepID=A0ABT7AGC1_9HYPH|nr:hypothetical protein [Chelatococcus sp. SYSU_G07232]MDJ1158421.1 hypothetical protein [Chelatococcus sp. SYSU_G07232]